MINVLLQQVFVMFFLILVGIYCRYRRIVTDIGKKTISNLVLYVILPFNIIHAYLIELESGFWISFYQIILVTILYQIVAGIICTLGYKNVERENRCIYQYATMCSNAGFIGNAVAEAVYGQLGLIYASIFLIPQRIMMWTVGISFFEKQNRKNALLKVLTHPCMVATGLGMVLLLFQIHLPQVCVKMITSVSNCCNALTMMYLGMVLYGMNITKVIKKRQLYYSFIRLILIPGTVFILCRLLGIDRLAAQVCVMLAGMPAGSTTAILATQYHKDEEEAVGCVCGSTLLSMLTIILWGYLCSMFL